MRHAGSRPRVVALAGGVGGARLAAGLQSVLARDVLGGDRLSVIVNTGDDFEHLGLAICPDLDTVTYTLAGLENAAQGWGRRDETWSFMEALRALQGEDWFLLGDKDLAIHVERSRSLSAGSTLAEITARLTEALGVPSRVIPASNDRIRTRVATAEGDLEFQHYFVRRRCEPRLTAVSFEGAADAMATPESLSVLADPALGAIVICPSNPYVSVAPILAVRDLEAALRRRTVPCVAVSPIVGGRAIKGPAAKMMSELGVEVSALGVARHYAALGLVDGIVVDRADAGLATAIGETGLAVCVTDTIMRDAASRLALADATLRFAATLSGPAPNATGA